MFKLRMYKTASGNPHGFDLGEISISGNNGTISTKSKAKIYLALVDLLHGLADLIESSRLSRFEFIAADSSFKAIFIKKSDSRIEILDGKRKISDATVAEIFQGVENCVKDLFSNANSHLGENDPVLEDLNSGIKRFELIADKIAGNSRNTRKQD